MRRLMIAALVMAPVVASAQGATSGHDQINYEKKQIFIEDVQPLISLAGEATDITACGLRPEKWSPNVVGYLSGQMFKIAVNLWPTTAPGISHEARKNLLEASGQMMQAVKGSLEAIPQSCKQITVEPHDFGTLDAMARKNGWSGN